MSKFKFSTWLSSSGGPLIVMDESRAKLWRGIGGQPSDYDLACQSNDYAEKLTVHDSQVMVLGDEPLQTAIATADDLQLIVRWKWAESDADVKAEVEKIDFGLVSYIENLVVEWAERKLVMFDAADTFEAGACLTFQIQSRQSEVLTFIYDPTPDTCLLIHVVKPLA